MAETKKDTGAPQPAAEVTQTAVESPGGVEHEQIKATGSSLTKDVKDRMTFRKDVDLHPEKESDLHQSDRTSAPNPLPESAERPPISTGRPDVPVVQSNVLGAGAHHPPDPKVYDPDGRLKVKPGE